MTTINAYSNYTSPALAEDEPTLPSEFPKEEIDKIMKATYATNIYAEWLNEVLTSDGTNPDEKYEW